MLEHQKIVLRNLQYNKELFRKELYKSLAWLNTDEQSKLKEWLEQNFPKTHREIMEEVLCTAEEKVLSTDS
jgi:hypothetical protein